jgi:diguanylate cyclase (GGDEF)-like protein/PAS domain S-box-containing protein
MNTPPIHHSRTKRSRREWLALVLVLVVAAGLLVGVLWHDHRITSATERDRLEVQARVVDEYLEQLLGGVNNALQGVRDELPHWAGPEFQDRAGLRLKALIDAMPGVRFISVVDASGVIRANSIEDLVGEERSEREFYLSVPVRPDPDRLYISEPYLGNRGVTSILVARAVLDAEGRFDGLVYAKLDPDFFSVVLRSVLYADDMHSALVSHSGRLFLYVGEQAQAHNLDLSRPGSEFEQHLHSGGASNFYRGKAATSDAESLMALRTIQPARLKVDRPLVIEVSRTVAATYQSWYQRMLLALLLYAVLSVGALAGLYVFQRQRNAREREAVEQDKERRANAERLELALGGAELGLWDRHFVTNVRTYNARWSQMLGYAPGEIDPSGTMWQEMLHPDDLAAATEALGAHVRGETPFFESEHRLRHKHGHWVWILARGRVVERDEAGMPVRMVGTHMDITERKRVEEGLRESEMRFRSLTELSSDWYWEIDADYRFTRLDGNLEQSTGMKRFQDIGLARWDIPALNMSEADWAAHRAALDAREVFRDLELQRVAPDGSSVWVSISGMPYFDDKGRFLGYRGVGRNISQRKQVEYKIEQLAFYDELTGLPNRRMLTDRLSKALATVARSGRHGALIFIDLDNFKDLNDTKGHDIGDLLLRQVAARLRECVREIDTVARLGGDEFVIMLEELSPYAGEAAFQAEASAKKILAVMNQPFDLLGQFHHSTPSIGIALFHDQLQSVEELLRRADLAMYQAKAAGRNALRFFDPAMQAAATERAALEADLRQAVKRQELRLHYQPVVDECGGTIGVEALVRWQHPQRGLILPGEFIDLAEKTGLIIPVGQWVLEAACQQLVALQAEAATRDLSIAVNVSARQFRQSDFADQVLDLLRSSGANPYRLKLELTESLLLSDVEDAIRKMRELRSIGVGFSLDDFGTGYSSLSYLKRLPLDQLKIDQSFVRDVLTDPNDAAIVRTILALARSMDMMAVAEGVENEGQRQFLLDNGCWAFQGYLFGRPVPMDQLALVPTEPTELTEPVG